MPLYVKDDFAAFYKATFERAVARQDSSGVFVEYAWDMSWCDPCAAERMSNVELTTLGAGWSATGEEFAYAGANAFVTRLHVRYDASSFPEDLNFVETGDRENFQGRYILRHPSTAPGKCEAGAKYRAELPKRFRKEADTLVYLTGWPATEVASRMAADRAAFCFQRALSARAADYDVTCNAAVFLVSACFLLSRVDLFCGTRTPSQAAISR